MELREQRLSIEEARQIDIVQFLSGLGYEPAKVGHFDYWYSSPLQEEKATSFKVNLKLNRWYDNNQAALNENVNTKQRAYFLEF